MRGRSFIVRAVALLIYVFLMASAYPPFMNSESAWFGYVPLLLLARYTRGLKRTFIWGWSAGFAFWLINLGWLLSLSRTGGSWLSASGAWIFLAGYCAVYTGLFVMLVSYLFSLWITVDDEGESSSAMGGTRVQLSAVFSLPLIWVGLEYLRGHLFTGFPWDGLGVTQFRNTGLIQAAEWGGVYAVSAVVMLVNVAMAFTGLRFVDIFQRRRGPRYNLPMMIGLGGAVAVWLGGIAAAKTWLATNETYSMKIAALQPAVPQLEKWDEDQGVDIYDRLSAGTRLTAALGPDLIVWPETASPDLLSVQTSTGAEFPSIMAGQGVPLLAGAIEYEFKDGRTNFYNSSFLFMPDGSINGVYRKMHLVPFGEYLPFERTFPSLSEYAPLGFSCRHGDKMEVFEVAVDEQKIRFSSLICFEDVFPRLSGLAVRLGARLLINQTNDAWFDGTSASVHHMANAVFRCVENRVPMVRSANTGVTCFINALGMPDQYTVDALNQSGHIDHEELNRMEGVRIPADLQLTFYTKYGDYVFALPCAAGALIVLFIAGISEYRKRKSAIIKGDQ